MGYVDKEYYTDVFKGTLIPVEDIQKELDFASDIIDQLTYHRIIRDKLTAFQLDKVQKAVCIQAEHTLKMGEFPEGLSSYTMNGTGVTLDGKNKVSSSKASALLTATGLRYRGLR